MNDNVKKTLSFLQNDIYFLSQIILLLKECRLLEYKAEALSRKKICISAVQNCKQATVRNDAT